MKFVLANSIGSDIWHLFQRNKILRELENEFGTESKKIFSVIDENSRMFDMENEWNFKLMEELKIVYNIFYN